MFVSYTAILQNTANIFVWAALTYSALVLMYFFVTLKQVLYICTINN